MNCLWCGAKTFNTYDKQWVQVQHCLSWSYPDGQGGNMVPFAAVYCSIACAGASLQSKACGGSAEPLAEQKANNSKSQAE